ncbi:hypothetical protein F2P81_015204 [Scophthalmus maximus]|uniref:Uncharacterized protein n=1 Tax=Scophthalmus maximus TaxID=52904 RepID=A0A6A4SPC9_SCOMX|nr:hypothetical protein F2P81_015204 [Scophthalmus maximus]
MNRISRSSENITAAYAIAFAMVEGTQLSRISQISASAQPFNALGQRLGDVPENPSSSRPYGVCFISPPPIFFLFNTPSSGAATLPTVAYIMSRGKRTERAFRQYDPLCEDVGWILPYSSL